MDGGEVGLEFAVELLDLGPQVVPLEGLLGDLLAVRPGHLKELVDLFVVGDDRRSDGVGQFGYLSEVGLDAFETFGGCQSCSFRVWLALGCYYLTPLRLGAAPGGEARAMSSARRS